MNAAGDFVVAWDSLIGQDGDGAGVFGQRYSRTGARQGSEFQVNSYTTGYQGWHPWLSVDASGNFVAVWTSEQDGDNTGLFGQRFGKTGSHLGPEFQVNTYTTGSQAQYGQSAIAGDPAGNFVVVWGSSGQDGDSYGLFGQRFDKTGARLGAEFQVNTYTVGYQGLSGLAADAPGNFVVVWRSSGQDGDGDGVFARRYDHTGVALGAEFQVNAYTTGSQAAGGAAAVTSDAVGDLVFVWESEGQDGDAGGIFAQRFTTSLCDSIPKIGCKKPTQSQKSALQLKNNATDSKDSLSWTWPNGEATTTTDFGDPLNTTGYSFCVYDESAGAPSLVLNASAPAAASCRGKLCWKATGTTGFKYTDARLTNGGLQTIILKAGAAGEARITVKGKGASLGMPALPLAQDTTVTAQLVNSGGACWEAVNG